ncbi:MAG: LytTR family DNA-binding domain-containing protein [Cyclobacteriaceae bacterium]|nr:LytTR family DNA-binding domain-containing protein [Cyclobacteriaceae bacterium]
MKMQCLIIDDEPLAINVIKKFLQEFHYADVVGTCENAMEAFSYVSENPVDLLFLDINMPTINGLDFLKSLKSPPLVIITSAYRDYAVDGFELNVLDYLVKPISFQRFLTAMDKAASAIREKHKSEIPVVKTSDKSKSFIFLKVDKKMVKVYLDEILYIESLKDYVRICTVYEDLVTHQNLNSMAKILPADNFIRIHKSYTIAVDKVKSIEGNCVEIATKLIPIGRNYRKEAKEHILNASL